MNWPYVLVFIIGAATELLWVFAVYGVERGTRWLVVLTAVLIPGINIYTVKEYVADSWASLPMLSGHAVGAYVAMTLKASLLSRTTGPTTGPGSRSSDPS